MTRKKPVLALVPILYLIVLGIVTAHAETMLDDSMTSVIHIAGSKDSNYQSPKKSAEREKSSVNDACSKEDSEIVSIIRLIANPDEFHGKCVLVVGFVNLEFESDAIYLHRDDYKYGLFKNGLWLNISNERYEEYIEKFNKKYCLVEGTFNAREKGHMELSSGGIDHIERLQILPEPLRPRE